jgi:hypothetical protein
VEKALTLFNEAMCGALGRSLKAGTCNILVHIYSEFRVNSNNVIIISDYVRIRTLIISDIPASLSI